MSSKELGLAKALKHTASKRVDDLNAWHQNTLDLFTRHLSEYDRSIIAKCFQNGLMLMSGAIPTAGGMISLTTQDAMFVAEVINILKKTPKVPHNRTLSRYVYIPNAAAIISAKGTDSIFPPQPGTIIPHLLPFASTLREGFAMYWTNRTDAMKRMNDIPCCVLRIKVPKNTNAFFWGPTPVPKTEDIHRMNRGLFPKKVSQFEVLLPPANLKVVKVVQKNLCKIKELIPEYQNHVPDLTSVMDTWCNMPVYECEMESLEQHFIVCKDANSVAYIAGINADDSKIKGDILLITESLLHDDVKQRLQIAIQKGDARMIPIIQSERMSPSALMFKSNIDYKKLSKHIERVISVMEVFNKHNPSNLKPYPIEEAIRAFETRNTTGLRKIIGSFWSDLITSYEGFMGYLLPTNTQDLITEIFEKMDEWLDLDIEDIEETEQETVEGDMHVLMNILENNVMLKGYIKSITGLVNDKYNGWFEFLKANSNNKNKLAKSIQAIRKHVRIFEKDLRKAKRYLNMEKLTNFKYTLKVKLVTQTCDMFDAKTMDRLDLQKEEFIKEMRDVFQKYTDEYNVVGVSFVPMHNETILLGKEKEGIYKNKYNYFGGKLQDKIDTGNKKADAVDVADVLFEEAFEEIGIALDANLVKQSLIKIIVAPYKRSVSLILLCNIEGVTKEWWNAIFVHRTEETCLWKYREMSKIDTFKVSALKEGHYDNSISTYVKESIHLFSNEVSDDVKSVNVRLFGTVKIGSNGKAKLISP